MKIWIRRTLTAGALVAGAMLIAPVVAQAHAVPRADGNVSSVDTVDSKFHEKKLWDKHKDHKSKKDSKKDKGKRFEAISTVALMVAWRGERAL